MNHQLLKKDKKSYIVDKKKIYYNRNQANVKGTIKEKTIERIANYEKNWFVDEWR